MKERRYPVLCMGCGKRVGWAPIPGSTGVCTACAAAMGVNLEEERKVVDDLLKKKESES